MTFPRMTIYFFSIFMLGTLACCKSGSSSREDPTQVQKESWHMTDEIKEVRADPGQEENLRMAAHDGDLEAVKTLLAQGISCDAVDQDGHTALMFAAFNGHSEVALHLLDAGAEIDRTDYLGRTALLYGSTGSFPETVRILLERGADPNKVDSQEHFSPLMHAAAEGHLEVVKVLMAFGADRSLRDVDGDDAASFALQRGHSQVAEYLNSPDN